MKKVLISGALALLITGCGYTQSALDYSKVQTQRIEAGYNSKVALANALLSYMKEANKDCGVVSEFVNGVPTTKVKECVRADDVLAIVDRVPIIEPQRIEDILQSTGSALATAGGTLLGIGGIWANWDTAKSAQKYSYQTQALQTQYQQSVMSGMFSTIQNPPKAPAPVVIENKPLIVKPEVLKPEILKPEVIKVKE